MDRNEIDDLYRHAILDHCRDPRNHDKIAEPTLSGRALNPFCGDEVEIQATLEGERAKLVGAQGVGCSINQASTSMLAEAIDGKSIEEMEAIATGFRGMMSSMEPPDEALVRHSDLTSLAGVRSFPVRIKCALLAWSALEDAIDSYRRENKPL